MKPRAVCVEVIGAFRLEGEVHVLSRFDVVLTEEAGSDLMLVHVGHHVGVPAEMFDMGDFGLETGGFGQIEVEPRKPATNWLAGLL